MVLDLQSHWHECNVLGYLRERNILHEAARQGDLDAVQRFTGKKRPRHPFSDLGKRLWKERDCEGNSPLHLAMHKGNWNIAQYLLDGHSLGTNFFVDYDKALSR